MTIRNRRALNCGIVGVTPGILMGSEWGESNTVLGFTIFSTSISHASRNSPVPSGRSVCSRPSDTGTFPPIDRAQLNVLGKNRGTSAYIYVKLCQQGMVHVMSPQVSGRHILKQRIMPSRAEELLEHEVVGVLPLVKEHWRCEAHRANKEGQPAARNKEKRRY